MAVREVTTQNAIDSVEYLESVVQAVLQVAAEYGAEIPGVVSEQALSATQYHAQVVREFIEQERG